MSTWNLSRLILPTLGDLRLKDISPPAVRRWLMKPTLPTRSTGEDDWCRAIICGMPQPAFTAKSLARGPYLRLPPNHRHAGTASELGDLANRVRADNPATLLVADLFSGAGGLSLGLENAGMRVVLGCDINAQANETHAHHFAGLTADWDLGDPDTVQRVGDLLRRVRIDVLAGGPPCQPFSKAGRSKIRHRVQNGLRDPHDERRDLWQSFVEVAEISRPRAVIMENVPDMALDREMFILRSICQRLENAGYSVDVRIVQTSDYGVPQYRQRLILVALAEHVAFKWPAPVDHPVLLHHAISDLPDVEPGWTDEESSSRGMSYAGPRTAFQRRMRAGDPDSDRIYDHVTRAVRNDDLEAFKMMDASTKYSDLPEHLRRYRADIFDDKYKRLDSNDLSRTITAHIAKDGYWYIHPRFNRTITVREAARIQTFPDHFRFAGTPTAAFRQIGNAVPPLLGEAIGRALISSLAKHEDAEASREAVGRVLADAWRSGDSAGRPWLVVGNRFQVALAEQVFSRQGSIVRRFGWTKLRDWHSAADLLQRRDEFLAMADLLGRRSFAEKIIADLVNLPDATVTSLSVDDLDHWVELRVMPRAIADIASLAGQPTEVADDECPVIVNQAVLRVVARYLGTSANEKNQRTDGRLGAARMLGFGSLAREAHLQLLEIGRNICVGPDPDCSRCPLVGGCDFASKATTGLIPALGQAQDQLP